MNYDFKFQNKILNMTLNEPIHDNKPADSYQRYKTDNLEPIFLNARSTKNSLRSMKS